jgi:hypothetical protein
MIDDAVVELARRQAFLSTLATQAGVDDPLWATHAIVGELWPTILTQRPDTTDRGFFEATRIDVVGGWTPGGESDSFGGTTEWGAGASLIAFDDPYATTMRPPTALADIPLQDGIADDTAIHAPVDGQLFSRRIVTPSEGLFALDAAVTFAGYPAASADSTGDYFFDLRLCAIGPVDSPTDESFDDYVLLGIQRGDDAATDSIVTILDRRQILASQLAVRHTASGTQTKRAALRVNAFAPLAAGASVFLIASTDYGGTDFTTFQVLVGHISVVRLIALGADSSGSGSGS